MNLDLLHSTCKDYTRQAFEEYKRQIDVELFPFDKAIHKIYKLQMFQDLGTPVNKLFVNNNLSTLQLKALSSTIKYYEQIASKTADNYANKFLNNGE